MFRLRVTFLWLPVADWAPGGALELNFSGSANTPRILDMISHFH
jgi:hypothetical protein